MLSVGVEGVLPKNSGLVNAQRVTQQVWLQKKQGCFMLKKYVLLCAIVLFIVGCHQKKDAVYYIHHAKQLKSTIESCEMMGALAANNQVCLHAGKIYNQLVELSNDFLASPEQFGKKVIENQVKLSKLKSSSTEYQALKQKTDVMIAMIGQATGI